MGFSREQAMEALLHANGLEQATEYCLTHQQPAPVAAAAQVSCLQKFAFLVCAAVHLY